MTEAILSTKLEILKFMEKKICESCLILIKKRLESHEEWLKEEIDYIQDLYKERNSQPSAYHEGYMTACEDNLDFMTNHRNLGNIFDIVNFSGIKMQTKGQVVQYLWQQSLRSNVEANKKLIKAIDDFVNSGNGKKAIEKIEHAKNYEDGLLNLWHVFKANADLNFKNNLNQQG